MSLKTFLAVGQSFFGIRSEKSPYEMRKENLLPIFDNAPRFLPEPKEESTTVEPVTNRQKASMPPNQRQVGGNGVVQKSPAPLKKQILKKSGNKRSIWAWLVSIFWRKDARQEAERLFQAELSLDNVKVIRNDLSDADLELIFRKKKSRKALEQVATEPTQHGWSRLASRLFEVGQKH